GNTAAASSPFRALSTNCGPERQARIGSAAWLDENMSPAIERPARLGMLGADRPLFAVTYDADPVTRDPLRHQVVHRGAAPPIPERQVVGVGAAFVALALDEDEHVIRLQPARVLLERAGVARPNLVLVEVEVDRLDVGIFCEARRVRSLDNHDLALLFDDHRGCRGAVRGCWRRRGRWTARCSGRGRDGQA